MVNRPKSWSLEIASPTPGSTLLTPSPYRDVTWGERERGLWRVNAGWDETGALLIDSRSDDIRALERMVLRPDGLLEIAVSVRGDRRNLEVTRVYRRDA